MFYVSVKTFWRKWEGENGKEKLFQNDSSFLSNLKNVKRNTIMTI